MINKNHLDTANVMLQIATKSKHIPQKTDFIKWIKIIAQTLDIKGKNYTVRAVEVTESQALNLQYRNRDAPTNVLSFPANLPAIAREDYLGDIIICALIVEQEALAQHKPIAAHWAHMLVHGVLHLIGFDHQDDSQAEEMENLEVKLLAKLGFGNASLPDDYPVSDE